MCLVGRIENREREMKTTLMFVYSPHPDLDQIIEYIIILIYYIYNVLYIEASSYEDANFLRKREKLFRCTKSYMIHIQNSTYKNYMQNHI